MSNSQTSLLFLQPHPHSLAQDLEVARARIDPHKQRITQTNMVYLIGLPEWMANEQTLKSQEYCGQYGQILKTMVKKNYFNQYASYSAYITFASDEAACLAVLGINNLLFDRNRIYASYGTNKYCAQFIKYGKCRKEECPFTHQIAVHKEIYEDDNKRIFQGQQDLARSYFIANYSRIHFDKTAEGVFPTPYQILQTFIEDGLISPLSRKSSIHSQTSSSAKNNDCRSQTSTSSSPSKSSKSSCDQQSSELSIEQKILLKLSVTKSSLFGFAGNQYKKQSRRIGEMLRNGIQPVLTY